MLGFIIGLYFVFNVVSACINFEENFFTILSEEKLEEFYNMEVYSLITSIQILDFLILCLFGFLIFTGRLIYGTIKDIKEIIRKKRN